MNTDTEKNAEKMPEDFLSAKIKKFKPYSVSSDIEDFINLSANESFINLPDDIVEEIRSALSTINFNRYPDFLAGDLIKQYAKNIGVEEKYIVAGNGSDELINIIINAFLSKGDKILTFEPDFSMYAFYSEIIEAQIITVEKKSDENFAIDFDRVSEIVKEQGVKLVIFSNPCNPTGKLVDKTILEKFVRNIDALVVIDEVYMTFCDDEKNQSFIGDFLNYPNVIILKSLSKAYGLASIRIGFAITNQVFADVLRSVKSPFNVNSVSQKIAEIVLTRIDFTDGAIKLIKKNKAALEDELKCLSKEIGEYRLHETQTNFVLLESERAGEIFDYFLKNKILIRQLNRKFLRISTGTKEENQRLILCLKRLLRGEK